ncbi:MAG: hypothetical protein ACOX3H_09930 [Saccharofermentanales bacterium]|jgi:D-alanyl-D-alanine carboxypeptidase (penicillin-binding protein 5/6)
MLNIKNKSNSKNKHNSESQYKAGKESICKLFGSILLLVCFLFVFISGAKNQQTVHAGSTANLLSSGFNPDVNINNVLVISTEFDKTLFSQQASSPIPLPAANQLMLSLLVFEQLELDERVSPSSRAIEFGQADPKDHSVNIEYNETYLVSNLLALQMYEHSYAATMVLAEHLAGSETACVELMNKKAEQLEMNDTVFTNVLGFADLQEEKEWSLDFDLIEDADLLNQKSTLSDLAKLVTAFTKNQTANQMFSEREYFTRIPDGTMIALRHPFDQIFASIDQGINGAWNLRHQDMSFSMAIGEKNQIKYLVLMSDKTRNNFARQIVELIQSVSEYYVVTPLVTQGQAYPSYDQTREGDKIGLSFLKTVNYIHPANDSFLHPAVKYISHGPHSRPLARGTPVGHVVFTMNDGAQIQAEVGSDISILSGNTLLSIMINSLQQNPNLSKIIISLVILLCIILLIKIIRLSKALSRQIRLHRLNIIQKQLKDRIDKPQS